MEQKTATASAQSPSMTTSRQQLRSDGMALPAARRATQIPLDPLLSSSSLTPEQISHLLSVGGSACDGCHKTLQELNLKMLDKCAKCGKAYYCSRECQAKQWKAGHKRYCRRPGEVQEGNYVRLHNLQAKPELNGTLVQVIAKDPNHPDGERWQVGIPGGTKSLSIATIKMELLRPLM